ncbi:MAG TPA: AAA family ATPase, partial [Clostridiales bacterium]|nr:AAA family ATPase [Clostridiales bacterium]
MENYTVISLEEINKALSITNRINNYYYSKMVGQRQLGTTLLISMIVNGHVLIESVPGLAKTTAAKTMTEAVNGRFSRIQCTPDLLPSDIIGTQIFNYQKNVFETKLGPVHANFVLLDEINRSSAKTQSAMLEVMQEHQTTIGGEIYPVPEIFMVIATQNPIEQ